MWAHSGMAGALRSGPESTAAPLAGLLAPRRGVPGVHELVWILSFISFYFLYPSTFNILEVGAAVGVGVESALAIPPFGTGAGWGRGRAGVG